jgi:osmotically inducible protein OsmC
VTAIERSATSVWEGDAARGHGSVTSGTGVLRDLEISVPTRFGDPEGKTSPEELVAAAHAGCFSMALAVGLGKAGTPPERLEAAATVTLDDVDGGKRITRIELAVRGRVPGIDDQAFAEAAEAAKDNCPISQLVKAGTELSLDARLDES